MDPSILNRWNPVPEYEGCYEAWLSEDSESGKVRSLERRHLVLLNGRGWRVFPSTVLKPSTDDRGYLQVNLCKDGKMRTIKVHRLVALIAYGPLPEGMETAHLNNVKTDNRPSNLAYKTKQDHLADTLRDRLVRHGEKHRKAKLTEEQVRYIRLNPEGLQQKQMAAQLGVTSPTIWAVLHGLTWTDVQ
jgi:HNH endonuclease/NUMOD4 motif